MTDRRPFLITIDTEGDRLWERPRTITTYNAGFLPRFQSLCERFGFKPVYLTNFEMANADAFVAFGRDLLARGAAEIGMHLHAWNSPPIVPLTDDDLHSQPYLVEYPVDVMRRKLAHMTALLEDRFQVDVVSHRAGRWALDERYTRLLVELGYSVDCSVTPGVSWRRTPGGRPGSGGADYSRFPTEPYFVDLDDISRAADSPLLEVPMTIVSSRLHRAAPWAYRRPLGRIVRSISPGPRWLRPTGRNLAELRTTVATAVGSGSLHLEFMLHSSELMPGGSPTFPDVAAIERLYADLEALFEEIAPRFVGMTLAEYSRELRCRDIP